MMGLGRRFARGIATDIKVSLFIYVLKRQA
jgi:hypothetical protein